MLKIVSTYLYIFFVHDLEISAIVLLSYDYGYVIYYSCYVNLCYVQETKHLLNIFNTYFPSHDNSVCMFQQL